LSILSGATGTDVLSASCVSGATSASPIVGLVRDGLLLFPGALALRICPSPEGLAGKWYEKR
jgi:hypothetical protein